MALPCLHLHLSRPAAEHVIPGLTGIANFFYEIPGQARNDGSRFNIKRVHARYISGLIVKYINRTSL